MSGTFRDMAPLRGLAMCSASDRRCISSVEALDGSRGGDGLVPGATIPAGTGLYGNRLVERGVRGRTARPSVCVDIAGL